ncbi:hypothetical protein [Tardiphaga sp. 862_B3_N1_1]|uniref:hypothetical protein n=1 Tax=Tardiphaga sp. 862_B3_N1_1 TaxID=3240763 RepID=UPI003F891BE8
MQPASTRFTLTSDARKRVIMSAREQRSGQLIITLQSTGNKLRDLGLPAETEGVTATHNVRIAQQKFSVHPSALSASNNQLHFNQVSGNGAKTDRYHVTNAIKSGRFAPLFAKRYSDLHDPVYDPKRGSNLVSIGDFDPKTFTAMVLCLIGARGTKFNARQHDMSIEQHNFEQFSVVLLSTFFVSTALSSSALFGFITIDPNHATNASERGILENVMNGFSPSDAISHFLTIRDMMRGEAIRTAMRSSPEVWRDPQVQKIAECRYFGSGRPSGKVFKAIRKFL